MFHIQSRIHYQIKHVLSTCELINRRKYQGQFSAELIIQTQKRKAMCEHL